MLNLNITRKETQMIFLIVTAVILSSHRVILILSFFGYFVYLESEKRKAKNNKNKNKYSIYLVPFDYDFVATDWFVKWGGNKPHVTLVKFGKYDKNKLNNIIKELSKGKERKRWVMGNRGWIAKYNTGVFFSFTSTTLYKLYDSLEEKLNLKQLEPERFHITIIKEKMVTECLENEIIKAIRRCRDWRLVLVEKNEDGVKWKENYRLYD